MHNKSLLFHLEPLWPSFVFRHAGKKHDNQYRGILVDVDDPPVISETDSNLEPPPTLINGILFLLKQMVKPVIHIIYLVMGFGTENANHVVIGK